jgi:hypothetical protein
MGWHKERETLSVVVMGMGEQYGGHHRLLIGLVLSNQLLAQADDARTSVDDDQVVASSNF